jgi:hypothetical protein
MNYLGRASIASAIGLLLVSCTDADVASSNLSKAADNFEVNRRFVAINGITDKYLLVVEGRCSLGNSDTSLRMSITCKTGPNEFKKHIVGLSDNVTFIAEQLEPIDVKTYHYRVTFKPDALLPAFDVRTQIGN